MATRYGVPGSNRITPQGRIVINGRRATNEIEHRIAELRAGRTAIKGGDNDDIWKMQRGNPVMSSRRNKYMERSTVETMTEMFILDAANGLGREGQSLWELNADLDAEGFIGIDADYRSKLGDDIQGNHAPIQLGGLFTVPNYGPKEIRKGDWVMLSAPDPRNPKPVRPANAPLDKYHYWTLPYNPHDQSVNKHAAYDLMRKMRTPRAALDLTQHANAKNLLDFTTELRNAIRMIACLGVVAALEAGVVTANNNADEWEEAGGEWMAEEGKEAREDFYARLMGAFGCASEHGQTSAHGVRVQEHGKAGRDGATFAMTDLLEELVFAKLPQYNLFSSRVAGGHRVTLGAKGEFNRKQRDLVVMLLGSLATANYEITRLIVGQAKTTGAPGQWFDIFLAPSRA